MSNRDHYIESGGARIRFRDEGAGPAIVLVHGWALDLDMWEPQFAGLAAHFRVIACDRRGFGLSSGEPDLEQETSDLRNLLDAVAVDRAVIVGMSQGARIALRVALRFAERVIGIVLDGPPWEQAVLDDTADMPMAHYRELVSRGAMDTFRQEWLRHPFLRLHTTDARANALLVRIIARYPGQDLRVPDRTMPLTQQALQAVSVPALVINGEHESASRRGAGAALARTLPHARYTSIPAAGHLPNLDSPQAYNELLASFVRELERPRQREAARSAR